MGQGTFTTLPLILAEELDADWAKVKPVLPPVWDDKKYGNPGLRRRVPDLGELCGARLFQADADRRRAGAPRAARCGRRRNGACRSANFRPSRAWSCTRRPDRRISYGEIAAFAKAPAELPKIEDKDLKPTASFRLIGKDVPRVEVPAQGHRRRQIRDGCAGARHGLRRGAAVALSGRRAADG